MVKDRTVLYSLIDRVNPKEIDIIYHLLVKFIPETEALPDEVEAIKETDEEIANGAYVSFEDFDWNE